MSNTIFYVNSKSSVGGVGDDRVNVNFTEYVDPDSTAAPSPMGQANFSRIFGSADAAKFEINSLWVEKLEPAAKSATPPAG